MYSIKIKNKDNLTIVVGQLVLHEARHDGRAVEQQRHGKRLLELPDLVVGPEPVALEGRRCRRSACEGRSRPGLVWSGQVRSDRGASD